ncbi:MAG: hypothetical protein FRX49_01953 [Trebouxia sp. A1-2]|nr:MAG: hypothetical protein FRX49_01953 [Trebouxia sp. A1-2]
MSDGGSWYQPVHLPCRDHVTPGPQSSIANEDETLTLWDKPDLDSLHRAGSDSTLPVTLVHKDLHKAGNDAIDVCVEPLKAEGCKDVVKVAFRPPVTAYRHTPRGMIMLSAAPHTTEAHRRFTVEQAAAVKAK